MKHSLLKQLVKLEEFHLKTQSVTIQEASEVLLDYDCRSLFVGKVRLTNETTKVLASLGSSDESLDSYGSSQIPLV